MSKLCDCGGNLKKFGRFGPERLQRFRCKACGKTCSEKPKRLFDDLRIDQNKAIQIVHLLTEGVGIRATARLAMVHPATVLAVLNVAGTKCEALLDAKVRNLSVDSLQLDELWAFCGTKQVNAGGDPEKGDQYTFIALDARTKLIVSHYTGKRDYASTDCFVADLAWRVEGRVQVTTDGWAAYPDTLRSHLLYRLDYAMMQKHYGQAPSDFDAARRYSPPQCTGVTVEVRAGAPREDRIGTSFVERVNLSVRTFNRRFTRLSLGWSRKLSNHRASVALFVAAYNFCKTHSTLGCTPAVGAKLTDHKWTVAELLAEATECR